MIFGKIDFLNLLPFHVFIKRYARTTQFQQALHYHKGVPSALNREFAMRRIDAAFISSITAQRCHHFGVGIVAQREVLSVLSLPNAPKKDADSATSNLLTQLLDLHGEVLIGDKALRYYYGGGDHQDLGAIWYERTHLPFVFALLCTHHHTKGLRKLSRAFVAKKVKIPYYILQKASHESDLTPAQILHYLTFISYTIGKKEQQGYKKFVQEAKKRGLNPPLNVIRYPR